MRVYRVLWLIFSLALVVLGVACIANPISTMLFLAYLLGFIMLFSGMGEIVYFFQTRYAMILVDGLLSCIFGLVLLFGGEALAQNFVPIFIALWLIVKGILWFVHVWRLSALLDSQSKVAIILMAGFYTVLGVLFVCFPHALAALLSFILGIVLMISGAVGLYFWYMSKKLDGDISH